MAAEGELVVVTPRVGTVSPWASKATDIARNCGLQLRRVERVVEYRIALKPGLLGGAKHLSEAELPASIDSRSSLHMLVPMSCGMMNFPDAQLIDALGYRF